MWCDIKPDIKMEACSRKTKQQIKVKGYITSPQMGKKIRMSFHAYKRPAYNTCKYCTSKARKRTYHHRKQWNNQADKQIIKRQ